MKPKFMPALTGLRGIVALWVVAFHLGNFLPTRGAPVIGMGWIGVDVFFILSGFVLAHVHISDFERVTGAGARRFLALRLSRIYPVHVATLIAACALAAAMEGIGVHLTGRFSFEALIANLMLVQAWGFFAHDTFNVLAWSISAEWLAYLAFPLLALAIVRLRAGSALGVGALALLLEVAAFRLLGRGLFATSGLAPLRISGEFVCGMCLCVTFRSGRLDRLPWGGD